MVELKPCPMCAGTDSEDNAIQEAKLCLHQRNGPLGRYYRVVCACGVEGPAEQLHTDAITAWNNRAAEARITQLEAALAKAQVWKSIARSLAAQFDHVGCNCTFSSDDCCGFARYDAALQNAGGSDGPRRDDLDDGDDDDLESFLGDRP